MHIQNIRLKLKWSGKTFFGVSSTLLIFSVFGAITVSTHVAYADINNTRADAWGTQEVAGSGWLNGGGVPIYSNGSQAVYYPAKPNNSVNGVVSGEEWQCVELVNRLYLAQGWTTSTWSGNGNQLYANAHSPLTKQPQGSITSVSPGDVLSLDYTDNVGHGAIISAVNGNPLTIINQNTAAVYSSATLSNGNIVMSGWKNYSPIGIIHHPATQPPAPTSPVPWNFEVQDGDPGAVSGFNADVGKNPQSVIYNNGIQMFYYDKEHGTLRHAWKYNAGWTFETLDGIGGANGRIAHNVGAAISVTTYNGTLQLFYYDSTAHSLRHGWSDANGWHFETLDTSGDVGSASTTLTYGTSIQVYYPNLTNGNLRHVWSDPSTGWHFENLDGDTGSVAGLQGKSVPNVGTSLTSTLDANGAIQLFYYSSTSQGLRHAWGDTTGWHFENLDGGNRGPNSGSTDTIGQNPSVVLYSSTLQLFSYNASKGALRHDWSDANGWHYENLDGQGSTGPDQYNLGLYSTAVVNGTTLQLLYYDSQWGELRHTWSDANG